MDKVTREELIEVAAGLRERYRALGAVLALGEFNVSELAELSGVQEPTVRTILRREGAYVEQIGMQSTGRRGGQPARWRLRPAAREQLRAQLQELEHLGAGPWLSSQYDHDTTRAGIISAENVLLSLTSTAVNPDQRAELIKLAEAQLDAAGASMPANCPDRSRHRVQRPPGLPAGVGIVSTSEPRPGTALLHADGSTCQHEGKPLATAADDSGPLCPAGEPITHVLLNGRMLTVEEAYSALMSIGETLVKALAPLADAFLEFGRKLAADPYVRVLAAAMEEIERERAREETRGEQNANSGERAGS